MTDRHITRRRFASLAFPAFGALAGCGEFGRTCQDGTHSVNGIVREQALGADVQIGGEVLSVHRDHETGTGRFNLKDPSGVAVVEPAEGWLARIDEVEDGHCLVVEGRVEEIYDDGKYSSCVDPADGTCSWLTQDVRIGDSTWTE